jgi:hypothetical protein
VSRALFDPLANPDALDMIRRAVCRFGRRLRCRYHYHLLRSSVPEERHHWSPQYPIMVGQRCLPKHWRLRRRFGQSSRQRRNFRPYQLVMATEASGRPTNYYLSQQADGLLMGSHARGGVRVSSLLCCTINLIEHPCPLSPRPLPCYLHLSDGAASICS